MDIDCQNIKTAFGKKLRSLRTSKGLSQEKLAELSDLDRTYISSVELGKRNISIVNICRLSAVLKIETSEFFDIYYPECLSGCIFILTALLLKENGHY
ncbi:helix-turn-helix domain-containing protein [Desulfobacula toluolica]|uniref:Transcriptional regulator, XRE family n=1 Tax=Desulfobacula toluolica (strain DSM 7467 / Tol2) TaxID=651182 RepID=K0NMV4_DESTT|nr:helix-turn-helix transcriptional regulator [Desulfobacula toluolica]CCK80027.1 transcriptional regulator, XRE family [Desulfobacula toluolica Tol2]